MKQFILFVKKELMHVLRDKKTLLILFGLPVVQILIFGFALTNEVKNSKVFIADQANDDASRRITAQVEASNYFQVEKISSNTAEIENVFKKGTTRLAIVFPANFNYDLSHTGKAAIQVIADASDPNLATTLSAYITNVVNDYNHLNANGSAISLTIDVQTRMLYNPQLKGAPNFVPGVMALVLMLICVMMTAISIVKEKETGTMEILLVSPFKPMLVIISKTIPYLLLSIVNISTILLISVFLLDLPVNGSLLLLFSVSILFIITCLSLGIFISVKTGSQQVAMLISLMGMLLPTMLFSGFMFPIENMPQPLQVFSNVIPAKWYYIIVKAIMIKGLGFSAIWKETLILAGTTVFLLVISLKNFKIRLA